LKLHKKLAWLILLFTFLIIFKCFMITNTYASDSSIDGISIVFGETITSSIDLEAELDSYTFTASNGDTILVRMSVIDTDIEPEIRLYAPNGSKLIDDYTTSHTAEFEYTITNSGTYTVLAGDHFGTTTGNYSIYIQKINIPGNAVSPKAGETISGSLDLLAEMDSYIFSANSGDTILVRMSVIDTDIEPEIRLYAPNGSKLIDQLNLNTLLQTLEPILFLQVIILEQPLVIIMFIFRVLS